VQVQPDNIIVSALKKSEDDNSLVLRFYEWAGKQGDVTLRLPAGVQSASETNMIEKTEGNLAVHDNTVTIPTRPYEIQTIKVHFSEPTRTETVAK
jgi:alpha-mannosidase